MNKESETEVGKETTENMDRTYQACRTLIEKNRIRDDGEFKEKMDILLLNGRLTHEEYDSLSELMKKGMPQG